MFQVLFFLQKIQLKNLSVRNLQLRTKHRYTVQFIKYTERLYNTFYCKDNNKFTETKILEKLIKLSNKNELFHFKMPHLHILRDTLEGPWYN